MRIKNNNESGPLNGKSDFAGLVLLENEKIVGKL